MAVFPAIEPNGRAYDIAGDFPMQSEKAWPAGFLRFRTGLTELTAANLPLDLSFLDLTEAQAASIDAHYRNQQGGTIPFTLPSITWEGHTTDIVPTGTQWRYIGPPTIERQPGGLYSATISLQSVDYEVNA